LVREPRRSGANPKELPTVLSQPHTECPCPQPQVHAVVMDRIVSAASCPACFPALASLGAAAGLGFLSEYEGLFITTLLPMFAVVALVANAAGWAVHRRWRRAVVGVIGPAIVLVAMLLFFGRWWTAWLLYAGLAMMVGVSLWDLASPAARRCRDGECAIAAGSR